VNSALLRFERLDELSVRLTGEVDLSNADQLEQELIPALAAGGEVIVDCSGLTFMDSTGFRVLINAARWLEGSGKLVLLSPSSLILRSLELLGVGQLPAVEIR
jgi:stage II sporulation protein AA (anti-sigma F factor antagonist)